MFGVFVLIVLLLIAFSIVQSKFPHLLPEKLRTWEFLPKLVYSIFCRVTMPKDADDEMAITPAEISQRNSDLDLSEAKNSPPKRSARVAPLENEYATTIKIPSVSQANYDNDDYDEEVRI